MLTKSWVRLFDVDLINYLCSHVVWEMIFKIIFYCLLFYLTKIIKLTFFFFIINISIYIFLYLDMFSTCASCVMLFQNKENSSCDSSPVKEPDRSEKRSEFVNKKGMVTILN